MEIAFSHGLDPLETLHRQPVQVAGGEILKFLGDGLLALFLPPGEGELASVAAAALGAAQEILGRMDALNADE